MYIIDILLFHFIPICFVFTSTIIGSCGVNKMVKMIFRTQQQHKTCRTYINHSDICIFVGTFKLIYMHILYMPYNLYECI